MELSKTSSMVVRSYEKGYRVTEDGRIFNPKGKELKLKIHGKNKYPTITVYFVPDTTYTIAVHRLAAYCFYGDEMFKDDIQVRHLSGDVYDISKKNIALGTRSENESDKTHESKMRSWIPAWETRRGRRPKNAKFTDEQVREIRRRRANGEQVKKLAAEYGITKNAMGLITRKIYYKDVV